MSVLVYIDLQEGKAKKASLEALSYAKQLAAGQEVIALVLGPAAESDLSALGAFGATKVLQDSRSFFGHFDARAHARAVAQAADEQKADQMVLSFNQNGKALAGRIAARCKCALISGATHLPEGNDVQKNVFSGKAVAHIQSKSAQRVIAINPNSFPISKSDAVCPVEAFNSSVQESDVSTYLVEVKKQSGTISLSEAERVVSAGRGLKGPENWGMIEELAQELGAATACSRPVGDMHWRPHHEHVGQTGLTIRPNLYIAIGISGAIQHLAGVNGSKVIVVINTDKEAPFFKAADYGILGDAFTVVPNLIAAYKKFKAQSH